MCISFDLPETIFGGKLYVCPVQLCSCKEKEWCRFYLRNLKLRFSIYVWTWSSFHRYHISVDVICFNVNHYIYLFCLLPIHILCTTLFAFLTSGYFHWLPSQIWSVQCPSSCSSSTLTTWVLIAMWIFEVVGLFCFGSSDADVSLPPETVKFVLPVHVVQSHSVSSRCCH